MRAAGARPGVNDPSMVARVGPLATVSREFRQARKGAAVAVRPGAGMWLARAATLSGPAPVVW